jgi:hypothetical protein
MYRPDVIAFDYETALLDGTPSVEFYRPDFRITSASFSWIGADGNIKSKFLVGESNIRPMLERIAAERIPLVCHNYQFEYGVTKCRFPDINLNIEYDTMRLTQVADNGGKEMEWTTDMSIDDELAQLDGTAPKRESGLKLVKCVSRWLPVQYHNHKEPYHSYLRENHGVKKGKEGANLHLLSPDMLEAYNIADSEITLRLFLRLVEEFKAIGYGEWVKDHWLYKSTARHVSSAKIRGARIDRAKLIAYRDSIVKEIEQIDLQFRTKFEKEIEELEEERLKAFCAKRKTQRGQDAAWLRAIEEPSLVKFNTGSNKQLAQLFVNKLNMPVTFWTQPPKQKKGKPRKKPFIPSPSFKSSHLYTWGEGGLILENRRKRMLVLHQCNSLLELSEYDGRWHMDLKVCGTATGRAAGGQDDR